MENEKTMNSAEAVQAKRNYKDTVFRMLFSDRANLLSLYNAVTGNAYDNPDELQIVTLENAIYMGMKNDLAFVFDTGIYLYEHQSTVNPNIPLRDLFYISAEYSKLVEKKSLYSSAVQKLPAPIFMVFYNGTASQADRIEYRLSDAYINEVTEPALELKVTVLNVNEGHNCQTAHCGRRKPHFVFGEFTSPIVPYRNLPQTFGGMTADCCSLV